MQADKMTPTRCNVVMALADCNMSGSAAAKHLFIDRSCVSYHIKRIKAITGKDPRIFWDLMELVDMVMNGEFDKKEESWE